MAEIIEEKEVFNTEDLRRRAYAAYWRTPGAEPIENDTKAEAVRIEDRVYVVLWSPGTKAVYVVYRIDSFSAQLRRMKRPPKELMARYERSPANPTR